MPFHPGNQWCEILELGADLERFSLEFLDSFSNRRYLVPNGGFQERIRSRRYLAGENDTRIDPHDQELFVSIPIFPRNSR
jgi:hypothetical protein